MFAHRPAPITPTRSSPFAMPPASLRRRGASSGRGARRRWRRAARSPRSGIRWSAQRAPAREAAPGWMSTSARRGPGDRLQVLRPALRVGQRAEQRDRVRMPWLGQERACVRQLDDLPAVHDGDAVAHLGDHAEVVADEHHAHPGVALQLEQQAQDLVLDDHVERGRRLVGEQDARARRDRDGDQHALPHPAAELVRVVAQSARRRGDADAVEQRDRAPAPVAPSSGAHAPDSLLDLVADAHHRVERAHRVLEDHRDVRAAKALLLRRPQLEQVPARMARVAHLADRRAPAAKASARRSVRHVTLLPDPLSPTRPRISRSRRLNETPSTARTTPSPVAMYV